MATDSLRLEPIKIRKLRGFLDVGQLSGTIVKGVLLFTTIVMAIFKLW